MRRDPMTEPPGGPDNQRSTPPVETQARPSNNQLRLAATFAGVVFLVVGIAGFIPGLTTHYSELTFAGHDSTAKLLGMFVVSVLK